MEQFALKDLFQISRLFNSKQPCLVLSEDNLILNPIILKKIELCTGLLYWAAPDNCEVCFANTNEELRHEYRQTFNKQDLLDYIQTQINLQNTDKNNDLSNITLPYPKNADEFWQR